MNKLKYKKIFWDWNGTLLSDVEESYLAHVHSIKANNFAEISKIDYRRKIRIPIKEFYTQQYGISDLKIIQNISESYFQHYSAIEDACLLHEHAEEILLFFKKQNLQQIILSAHSKSKIENQVKLRKIEHYFNSILALPDHQAGGSKLGVAQEWFQINNDTMPHEVLLIGDTKHDYEVAKELGIDVILTTGGLHHHEVLEPLGVPMISNLKELIRLIA